MYLYLHVWNSLGLDQRNQLRFRQIQIHDAVELLVIFYYTTRLDSAHTRVPKGVKTVMQVNWRTMPVSTAVDLALDTLADDTRLAAT